MYNLSCLLVLILKLYLAPCNSPFKTHGQNPTLPRMAWIKGAALGTVGLSPGVLKGELQML
jgi:hypothetical protein